MYSAIYRYSIKLLIFLAVMPMSLMSQAPVQMNTATPGFSSIETKGGNCYIGTILDTVDNNIRFYDNNLGPVNIAIQKIRKIEPEQTNVQYSVELTNGNIFVGTILNNTERYIVLQTSDVGLINIRPELISHIEKVEVVRTDGGAYPYPNPNATRYLFAPSAIPLNKGEGYYQNAYVIANSANYGVTNNLSLGGGILLPFAAYATPKISGKVIDGFYIGVGALVGLLPEQTVAGIGYGLLTFGNIENNITLGAGYGFIADETTDKPIFTVNGMARVSEKVALVSENWIVNLEVSENNYDDRTVHEYKAFISYGVRFMWDRFTIDGAFINGPEIFDVFFIGVPYIDFIMRF